MIGKYANCLWTNSLAKSRTVLGFNAKKIEEII
jgi:hypothetical protein